MAAAFQLDNSSGSSKQFNAQTNEQCAFRKTTHYLTQYATLKAKRYLCTT